MTKFSNLSMHHSSSHSQLGILMNYRSCHQNHCPRHILNCQCSHHQSHNLRTLLNMGQSLCNRFLLHFHQNKDQVHNSSHSQKESLMKYHSCHQDHFPGHILNCQYSHHQSHNLHTLLNMGQSLCSSCLLHSHQNKGQGHNSSQSREGNLMNYRSCHQDHCPRHISNCHCSHHQSRNLHTLLNMGQSLCSSCLLHSHQNKGQGHNSSQSREGNLMNYRSCHQDHCPGHILNCQYSHHQSHNLLSLLHIGWNLCNKHLLHFHQSSQLL